MFCAPGRCVALLSLLLLSLVACSRDEAGVGRGRLPDRPTAALPDAAIAAFLSRHWSRPLPAQGAAPAGRIALETSLDPDVCAYCHPQQAADWRRSRHAAAIGPGLLGQIGELGVEGLIDQCFPCHAPLAEQAAHFRAQQGVEDAGGARFGAAIQHGLACAGCHVRGHQRFGPPPRDGAMPSPQSPHGGFTASAAFTDSRFCAACHQFDPDGPRLAGKLLEDTYAQWQATDYARDGHSCQSCHMPERRHVWHGIHDPGTVRTGITLHMTVPALPAGRVLARLEIANTGVGHHFPTYVTPQVLILIGQVDAQDRLIEGTETEQRVGWSVSLDLAREFADTRIAAGERRRFDYDRPRHSRAHAVRFRVRVEPDAFYARFYRAVLADPAYRDGREELTRALSEAEASPYDLVLKTEPLAGR